MAGTYTTQFEGKLAPQAEDFGPEDMVVAFGRAAFTTSGTSVNVAVPVETCECGLLTIRDGDPVANDLLSHDGTVDSNGLTVFRPAGTTSGLTFDYLVIGMPSVATPS